MKEVIYKYPLEVSTVPQPITMPTDSRIVKVESQHNMICVWAIVPYESEEKVIRTFYIVATGQPFSIKGQIYRGTVLMEQGRYVWHVWEDMTIKNKV